MPATRPSAGRVGDQVGDVATSPLGGDHERPVLDEAARVDEIVDVLASRPMATSWRRATASGRDSSSPARCRSITSARSARTGPTAGRRRARRRPRPRSRARRPARPRTVPCRRCTASPGAASTFSTRHARGATTSWCIFIDSTTARTPPPPISAPGIDLDRDDRALQVTGDAHRGHHHRRPVRWRAPGGSTRPCVPALREARPWAPNRGARERS